MRIEPRELQHIQVRHSKFELGRAGPSIVWWQGAVIKNKQAESLPHVVIWCRRLMADGSLGNFVGVEVGITELGLAQVGTVWDGKTCKQQIVLERRQFDVDFSRGNWRLTSQAEHYIRTAKLLIPEDRHPLNFRDRDRSQLLEFTSASGGRLLVPCLEFYSRCYGRSGHVARVLSTYPWERAQERLYVPFTYHATPGHWPIKLASSCYNDDAVFLAHVLHDTLAEQAAKSIYAHLDNQYPKLGGKAFLRAEPWFKGPATLIVEGRQIDHDTFLALRIVGGSDPKGSHIDAYRENPGKADEGAPDGAPTSRWRGGRELNPDPAGLIVNLTPDDEPGQNGDIVEILNPSFVVIGEKRRVAHHRLANASTRPGQHIPNEESEQHSSAERHGAGGKTGYASIHTEEIVLPSSGAVQDVWEGLQFFRRTQKEVVTAVGWYSAELGEFVIEDGNKGFQLVALKLYEDDEKELLPPKDWKWVYKDSSLKAPRGVLVAYIQTTAGSACLFENERRRFNSKVENDTFVMKEESYSGLVLVPPADRPPREWVAEVLDGIRKECGVMERVQNHAPPSARFYHRSKSSEEEVAGQATVVNALNKVGIQLPKRRPQSDDALEAQASQTGADPTSRKRKKRQATEPLALGHVGERSSQGQTT